MGFVKSSEEIARIEHALSFPRFVGGQMLSVEFTTDESVIAEVLPPPLEAVEAPTVRAMVGRWQSNCVGDFYGGSIYVAARHEGIDGEYVLAMYMDNDVPTIYGRDLFGEPKKIADSGLLRRGDAFRGYIDRGGVRIVELQAEMNTDTGAFDADGYNFNFKARPADRVWRRTRSSPGPSSTSTPRPRWREPARSSYAAPCTTRSTSSRSAR
jgi:acetoacetate decarboxylase